MKLFLKHNRGYILIYILSLILTGVYTLVMGFISLSEILYILLFNTFILLCFLAYKYYENRQLYKVFKSGVSSLNDALLDMGSSDLSRSISELLKSEYSLYEAEIQKSNLTYNEHIAFINQWVHQMKTPLSVIKLQLKEFEGEERAILLEEEIYKLHNGLNLALYYARLDSFQKDFVIEKIFLKTLVVDTVNKNKNVFVKNRIIPRVQIDDSIKIYSDIKWLGFILEQIIVNGVKYSKDKGRELIIKAEEDEREVKLSVVDEGIGILKKDIRRVFDKFFTGENGRKYGESTGMGLYMAKEVCCNLGHEIEIKSEVDVGTEVSIRFKKD